MPHELLAHPSYPGLLLLLFLTGAGLPVPEDAVVLLAGYLVFRGETALYPTVAVALVGVLAGDVFLYLVGRRLGRRVIGSRLFAGRVSAERLERAERRFARWGAGAVVLARFVAGVRMALLLAAGVLRMRFSRFLLVDLLAALVNVPLLILLGRWAGPRIDQVAELVARARLAALAVVLLGAAAWLLYRQRRGST